ncbi:MAG TPA: MATE family efflux transporter [Paracoccus solventivorans]|uniref:MATE family efflux transporter n=1 Tax=Paracoccus solventivorans TaxID=53463 RepID=A0A832PQY1_9RHOB|nr:MATE family efflux transporter [Paracoccus solventivorans]HHW35436.1 MATE family efflux transporter [Paracoccus solventivorans]
MTTPDALTHRRVLAIALPIVLANATVPILGAVDTGVVGRLGQAAPIGAVGLGAVILTSVYWIFGFLRMGTSGMVAQSHGAGDGAESGAHLIRALAVAGAAGAALIVLQWPLMALAFRLAPASAEVESLARTYVAIRIWGAPATIAMYALTGWMIATERTRAVLAVQMLVNLVNIGLDLLFVLGFGWGVRGVAAATLAAELSGLALALYLAAPALREGARAAGIWARAQLGRMLRVNSDIMLRSVLLQGAMTAFVFVGAGMGDVALAANQVLLQFLAITAFGLDGLAFAAESLVGQAVGARRPERVRRAAVLTSGWALAGAAVLSLVFALAGGWLVSWLTTSAEVRAAAAIYLPWLVLAPLLGVASWMLDGIFIGATLTREMRRAMLPAVAAYGLAVLLLVPLLGNHGLWAALMVLYVGRALAMAAYYPRVEQAAAPLAAAAAPG